MGNISQICRTSLTFVALGLIPTVAQPALYSWDANGANPANGDFGTANNWNPNTAPTSLDTAEFDLGKKAYAVTFPGTGGGTSVNPRTYVTDRLVVGTNTVTFNEALAASTYEVNSTFRSEVAIVIGETAGDSGVLNNTLVKLSGTAATIGDASGSTGVLNANAGTFELTGSGAPEYSLIVGNHGSGTLNVLNGAYVNLSASDGSMIVGKFADSTGAATISGTGSLLKGFMAKVNSTGAMNVMNGGHVDLSNGLSVSGTVTVTGGGQLTDTPGAVSGGIISVDGSTSKWVNHGNVTIAGGSVSLTNGGSASSLSVGQAKAAVINGGAVTIDGLGSTWVLRDASNGKMDLGAGVASTLSLTNGGSVEGFGLIVNKFGELSGDGTVRGTIFFPGYVNNGGLANWGVIAPGNSLGPLHVDGDYFQASIENSNGGTLQIELGGANAYDQLLVAGTIHLTVSFPEHLNEGGTLAVSVVNGFAPHEGEQFNILDFSEIIGTFETINLPALAGELAWDASKLYTTGVISVILAGDYNENGVVDSADYVLWRKNNNTGITMPNDLTPGTDQTDYAVWRSHFGQTAGSGAGATASANGAVPEPKSRPMLILGMLAIFLRRRQVVL